MPIQNNLQQQAVAANMGSTDKVAENLRQEILRDVRTEKAKPAESVTKQALDGTSRGKVSVQILAELVGKMGNDALAAKITNKFGRQESDFLTENKEDNFSEKVDLSLSSLSPNVKSAKGKREREGGQEGQSDERGRSPEVKEYLKSYSSFLVNGGGELKKEIDKREKTLLQEGKLSAAELASLRTSAAKTVRQEIVKQLQAAYNDQLFADGKIEELVAKQGVNGLTEWAFLNERLGGKEFGGDYDHLEGANKEALAKAKDDVNNSLDDELTRSLTRKMLSQGKDAETAEKEIGELLKLATKCGFDVQQYAAKMPEMIIHLGLNPSLTLANQSAADQGQRDKKQYQYNEGEEKDLMTEELRTLYMRRAVYGDWRANLSTSVRMMRAKNGLMKLGLRSEDFSRLEKEGRQLAKLKLAQMLQEGFEERASFARLNGPAYSMVEKKIKTVLKNLAKLGLELDDKDLEEMRNKANEKMFPELQQELKMIDNALQVRNTDYLQNKRKTVLQIIERIAGESNLPWESDKINSIQVAT